MELLENLLQQQWKDMDGNPVQNNRQLLVIKVIELTSTSNIKRYGLAKHFKGFIWDNNENKVLSETIFSFECEKKIHATCEQTKEKLELLKMETIPIIRYCPFENNAFEIKPKELIGCNLFIYAILK